jgi:hypothetical protein
MHPWMGLGIFFLGAAAGALLTAIAFQGRIRKLRSDVEDQTAHNEECDHGNGASPPNKQFSSV